MAADGVPKLEVLQALCLLSLCEQIGESRVYMLGMFGS